MDAIYAPWRGEYIRGGKPGGCIFCKDSLRNDDFLLFEGEKAFVMMNRYPYSCGHLLIIPIRHVSALRHLDEHEKLEIFSLLELSISVLKEIIHPDGFNLGINLGKVAGAGVDDHIHTHIVPRWNGDTNFMTVVCGTRVISEDIMRMRNDLLPHFARKFHQEV